MSLSRSAKALWLSAYSSNTTTDLSLKLPLGAPVFCGMEIELVEGAAVYHISRSEHRECRIFVEQQQGVLSCRETPPINARFRRNIRLSGLQDATIRVFSEPGCECALSTTDPNQTPKLCTEVRMVTDERHGTYLEAEHLSGTVYMLIGHKGTA